LKEIESKPAFMTEEEMEKEKMRVKRKLGKPLKINAAITELEQRPGVNLINVL
jgi:hypothetical protein